MTGTRVLLSFIFAAGFAGTAPAQIIIGGHKPFYDRATQSLLFVTDTKSITSLTASVATDDAAGWHDIKIDGQAVNGTFSFGDATGDRCYQLTATADGQPVARTVRFTCMPVISISKATAFSNDYEQAVITVDAPDGTLAGSTTACRIKHRGGTTNSPDRHKRNYKFKTTDADGNSKDMSFFGMRNDNNWILDAGQVDLFRMRNRICHELWLDFSRKPYYFTDEPNAVNGCHTKETELFINNEYRGIYNLMEPVDRKQLKLKKYKDKDGVHGVLYKSFDWNHTKFWNSGDVPFSNADATWTGFEAKYPEPGDDADTTDYKPLVSFCDFVAGSADDTYIKEIDERLDIPVYMDYSLMMQLAGAFDNAGKNMYWSVYDKTKKKCSKLVPTPWDMDATFGQFWYNGNDIDSSHVSTTNDFSTDINIDYRLLSLDRSYREQRNKRYAELRATWFSYDSLTARFEKACEEIKFSGAAFREQAKWSGDSDLGGLGIDWDGQLAYIKSWIGRRLEFTDSVYNYSAPTGITTLREERACPAGDATYNLMGQKVSDSYKGVVVRGGKKILMKSNNH